LQEQSTKDVVVALARGQAKARQDSGQQVARLQAELADTAAQLVALQQAGQHNDLKQHAHAEQVRRLR
jgi:N-acetylglutamate synthase/N-acetylornithine aminotransferase